MKSSRSGAMLPIISFGGQNVGAGMRDRMTLLPCLSLPLLALSEPAEGGMTAPVTGVWLPFLRSLRPQACPPCWDGLLPWLVACRLAEAKGQVLEANRQRIPSK